MHVLHLTVMLECDAQGLTFVMFTNVRSLLRPPVSSAVSRGTGLEDEPSRHPQEEDPPPAMLRVARCALRCALCAALVAFAAMIRCYIRSRRFPLSMEAFSYLACGTQFCYVKKIVTHGGPSLRVIRCYDVTYIPGIYSFASAG